MVNPYQPPAFEPPPGAYYRPVEHGAPPGPVEREVSAMGAFRFVLSDENWWKNALFGFLLQFIPLAGPVALMGWLCEVHRRLVWHYERPVPKFSFEDFGEYMKRGWMPFTAQMAAVFLFLFPAIIAGVVIAVVANAGGKSGSTIAPLLMLALLPLLLLLPFAIVATTTIAELTESLGTALSPSVVFRYLGPIWLKAIVSGIFLMFVAMGTILLGVVLCFVGTYLAAQVVQLAALHWRWQLYNEGLRRGAEHLATKPPSALPSERRY